MPHIHIPDVPWLEQRSPGGRFQSFARNVSLALGGIPNTGTFGGGHPFDVQIRRLPPGKAVCPFHLHYNQWEFYLVESGHGMARAGTESREIGPGDFFVHPPGEPHQLTASAESELIVVIVADNASLDACHYPDSDKWGLRPPGKFFRMDERPYFDGEEPALANAPEYRPSTPPRAAAITPFASRLRNLRDLAWEPWSSPQGRYRSDSKELSLAVGAKHKTPTGLGGHPFDVELVRVPPKAFASVYHYHAAQWEMYYIISGQASVRTSAGIASAGAGDVWLHPPRDAHQIGNTSATEDLVFYLIADNPPVDYSYYPDSNKWGMPEPRQYFRVAPLDYFDGEE